MTTAVTTSGNKWNPIIGYLRYFPFSILIPHAESFIGHTPLIVTYLNDVTMAPINCRHLFYSLPELERFIARNDYPTAYMKEWTMTPMSYRYLRSVEHRGFLRHARARVTFVTQEESRTLDPGPPIMNEPIDRRVFSPDRLQLSLSPHTHHITFNRLFIHSLVHSYLKIGNSIAQFPILRDHL